MNEFNQINSALSEVGRHYGIQGFYLSPEGTCALNLKDGTGIHFEWIKKSGRLVIYTPLLRLPNDKALRLTVYELLAELNCFPQHRGTLGVHKFKSLVFYQIALDVDNIDAEHIDRALSDMLEQRPILVTRIETILAPAAEQDGVKSSSQASSSKFDKSWSEILDTLQKKGMSGRFLGCSEREIATIEAEVNDRLPAQYRQLLTRIGRGAEILFTGEDIFYPNILTFGQRANEILRADGGKFILPKDAFVFLIHRDVLFLFFHLGVGDDPPIYSYSYEEGPKGFVKAYKSFSEFMHVYLALHHNNYKALVQLNAANLQ